MAVTRSGLGSDRTDGRLDRKARRGQDAPSKQEPRKRKRSGPVSAKKDDQESSTGPAENASEDAHVPRRQTRASARKFGDAEAVALELPQKKKKMQSTKTLDGTPEGSKGAEEPSQLQKPEKQSPSVTQQDSEGKVKHKDEKKAGLQENTHNQFSSHKLRLTLFANGHRSLEEPKPHLLKEMSPKEQQQCPSSDQVQQGKGDGGPEEQTKTSAATQSPRETILEALEEPEVDKCNEPSSRTNEPAAMPTLDKAEPEKGGEGQVDVPKKNSGDTPVNAAINEDRPQVTQVSQAQFNQGIEPEGAQNAQNAQNATGEVHGADEVHERAESAEPQEEPSPRHRGIAPKGLAEFLEGKLPFDKLTGFAEVAGTDRFVDAAGVDGDGRASDPEEGHDSFTEAAFHDSRAPSVSPEPPGDGDQVDEQQAPGSRADPEEVIDEGSYADESQEARAGQQEYGWKPHEPLPDVATGKINEGTDANVPKEMKDFFWENE